MGSTACRFAAWMTLLVACSALSAQALVVAADGTGDHRSIQDAIDAVEEGGRIRVRAGVYRERLSITKRVTIAGNGDASIVGKPEVLNGTRLLAIAGAAPVLVRGLRFSYEFENPDKRLTQDVLVEVRDADLQMRDCALVGSPGHCIFITGSSEVELRDSLIAGAWNTGVRVDHVVDGVGPKVAVVGCEIRNCYHRGITIASGGRSTITECRISGSSWHGIRYDDCAPTVTNNLIFDNARSGIYASGATAGRVEGNVFWRNGHNGISFWTASKDVVTANTFAGNLRSNLEVLGAAKPVLRRNLFVSARVGIALGHIGGRGGKGKRSTGRIDTAGDVFWAVGEPLSRGVAKSGTELRQIANPGLRDAGNGDLRLPTQSPLRRAGVGAQRALLPESRFPIEPVEQTTRPDRR